MPLLGVNCNIVAGVETGNNIHFFCLELFTSDKCAVTFGPLVCFGACAVAVVVVCLLALAVVLTSLVH